MESGILDDPTILSSIERARDLYAKGNFTAIKKYAQKIITNLESDRFYDVLTKEKALKSIDKETLDGFDIYKFDSNLGNFACPYGLPIVIGAPPKNRKTTYALNMLYRDVDREIPSIFGTLELSPDHVIRRLLQIHVRLKEYVAIEFEDIAAYCAGRKEYREFVEKVIDTSAILEANKFTAAKLCTVIDRLLITRKAKTVYIDYFQRMRPDVDGQNDTRVGYMQSSRYLTDQCKSMNACFIVLSQLNAMGEYKETGALTEDAGLALTLKSEPSFLTATVKASRFSPQTEIKLSVCNVTGAIL